jgi:chromosome segregation protein
MEVNTIFLCTTIGALVGTMVGILLMNRKVRLPITGADLTALRTKLQSAEASLAASNATVEDLRKQISERDQSVQQKTEELKKKQEQFDQARAEIEKDKLQRSVTEQLGQDLNTQNTALVKARNELESKMEMQTALAAERASQIAGLETQLAAEKYQVADLSAQLQRVTADGVALSHSQEQERRQRISLEAELSTAQERIRQLTEHVAELESERSLLSRDLIEERESASRGMELLMKAQENLSRAAKPVRGELRRGEICELPVARRAGEPNASVEPLDDVPSAMSGD